ncbi:MAG TPA: TIGR03000 domain-containing protein [Gemmataceae bacterium]|nr:TIGR03000 domain-containing protein [Gemmataceae bacterium]
MYSMVLMAALTTSVDLPDLGRRGCCGGCYGGCYGGCFGGRRGHGCCGCYGYGCMGYGCMGYSMGYGCMGYSGMGYGCMGCYGGGMMIMPGTAKPSGEKAPKPKEKKESMVPAPATIVVELPAEAKLLIDNEATTSTGSSRVFQSPTLNPGKEYHYTLKAEIVRDGKPVKAEQVVTVTAGETTPVKLTMPPVGVAQR